MERASLFGKKCVGLKKKKNEQALGIPELQRTKDELCSCCNGN